MNRLLVAGVVAGGYALAALVAWLFYVPAQRTFDEGYAEGFRFGMDRGRRRGLADAQDAQMTGGAYQH